jgi:demethylmenaquinone methyltransferase/2-methoxy-6-polyprenyl-1,4-benzoquinol methylase
VGEPREPERARRVQAMFGRIAGRYDLMNSLMTAGQDSAWRAATVAAVALPVDGVALDVGTGTARLALALARRAPRGRVVGVEIAEPMLRRGTQALRSAPEGDRVRLVLADALALPFAGATFDCATTAFTVRNVTDVVGAFREMARVVRPGGRVACLEITRPRTRLGPLFRLYFARLVPLLGRVVAGDAEAYRYLPASAYRFLEAAELAAAMRQAGLLAVRHRWLAVGTVALHVGEVGEPEPR